MYSTDEDVHNKRDKMETCCTIQTLCETLRRSVHASDSRNILFVCSHRERNEKLKNRIKRVLYFLFNQTTNETAIS